MATKSKVCVHYEPKLYELAIRPYTLAIMSTTATILSGEFEGNM